MQACDAVTSSDPESISETAGTLLPHLHDFHLQPKQLPTAVVAAAALDLIAVRLIIQQQKICINMTSHIYRTQVTSNQRIRAQQGKQNNK